MKLNPKNLKTKWDLSVLLPKEDEAEIERQKEEIEKANQGFVSKWKEREDYLKDPGVLKEALDDYERLMRNHGVSGRLGYYFFLKHSLNQTDPKTKAWFNKIEEFSVKTQNSIQFFELKISKISLPIQKKMLESNELNPYKHFLEKLFQRGQYLLSEEVEKVLSLKSAPSHSNWVSMTSEFLSKEERKMLSENGKIELATFEKILSLTESSDRKVRKKAAKVFNDILKKRAEVAVIEINSILANKKVDDDLRGMKRPDLSRHISDDVKSQTADVLVETVLNNFEIAKRFYNLKAKLLKVKSLNYSERNVPAGKIDRNYSYEQAFDLVYKAFDKLDPVFSEILEKFAQNGQIDVYSQKGKRGGAFCDYGLLSHPIYILLNFNNKLRDITILAHEAGHGINNELMRKQNALSFGTPTSTAEVASTVMEDFVLQELSNNISDEERLVLNMGKLNAQISTIFRQVACYRFEQDLHKSFRGKGYLSEEEIGDLFEKHMSSYMGKHSRGCKLWWIDWHHIRNFFYVYTYAMGLLVAMYIQGQIKKNPKFVEKLKEFLSAGMSDSPENIFKKMGIEMSKEFWQEGLQEVKDLLNETEELAKKLGKI